MRVAQNELFLASAPTSGPLIDYIPPTFIDAYID